MNNFLEFIAFSRENRDKKLAMTKSLWGLNRRECVFIRTKHFLCYFFKFSFVGVDPR